MRLVLCCHFSECTSGIFLVIKLEAKGDLWLLCHIVLFSSNYFQWMTCCDSIQFSFNSCALMVHDVITGAGFKRVCWWKEGWPFSSSPAPDFELWDHRTIKHLTSVHVKWTRTSENSFGRSSVATVQTFLRWVWHRIQNGPSHIINEIYHLKVTTFLEMGLNNLSWNVMLDPKIK